MDIEETHRRYIEQDLGEDFPIRHHDTNIRSELADSSKEIIIFYFLWLEQRDIFFLCHFRNWGRDNLMSSSTDFIRVGNDSNNL